MITTTISFSLKRKLTALEDRRRWYGNDDITCNVQTCVICSVDVLVCGIEGSDLLRHHLTALCSRRCVNRHCNEALYKCGYLKRHYI